MKVSRPGSRRSAVSHGRRSRSLRLESLEDRRMLAGDSVELLPDSFTVVEESSWATLDVLVNDEFPEDYSGARRISSASSGSLGGVVRLAGEGALLEYQPPAGVHGEDSLVYIVDGQFVGQVTVTIEPPLIDDTYDVVQHSSEVRLEVLANDPFFADYAGQRVITAVSAASMASSVRIADGGDAVFYTPAADAQGIERFRYLVDGQFEAIVSVWVHRPVRNDSVSVEQNSSDNVLDILDNDTYVDSRDVWHDVVERVTSVSVTQEGGTVSVAADGKSLVYAPPQDFVGTDRFAYLADGVHEATAYVAVTRPVRPDSLVVHQQSSQQVLDVLANDFWTSAYSGARQITSVTAAEHGSVELAPDGRALIYTPDNLFAGMDRFEYTVDDALTTSVMVEVKPLAQPDSYRFGVSPFVTQYTLSVLRNDLFERNYTGPRQITSITNLPDGDTVEILDGARSLRFTPADATLGGASFSYIVDDLFEARVAVSLVGYLAADSVVVKQNSQDNSFDVLRNDFGLRYQIPPYDGPRRITSVAAAESGGEVAIEADGRTVRYTPPADFLGMDRFAYVVDGVQSATVTVRVTGYARDDRFRVDPDSLENRLRVLVNDRVDPGSGPARRVASVTETAAGAAVTLSDDGQTILYTPPAEFSGTDTFAYFLDNGSRGEVTIEVTSDLERLLPRFGDQSELEQYLIDDALERYAPLFGQPVWNPWVNWDLVTLSGTRDGDATPESGRTHSETNVQVAGVDEGDIIEVDSDYVYIVAQDSLVIAAAWPAEQLHVASRTELAGRPLVEYLRGDRLTVISDTGVWVVDEAEGAGDEGGVDPLADGWFDGQLTGVGRDGIGLFPPRGEWVPSVTVTVFDISDRTVPAVVQETRFDGRYVDSRSVNGFVYLVLQNSLRLPPPESVCSAAPGDGDAGGPDDGPLPSGNCVYQTQEEYLDSVRENIGQLITDVLPEYSSYAADHEFVRGGLLTEAADIFRPGDADMGNLLVVTGIDVTSTAPGPISSAAVPTSPTAQIYASRDNLYVFDQGASSMFFGGSSSLSETTTSILKFAWNAENGQIDFVATGEVPGSLHNQFSVDEYNGLVRIATTTSNYDPGESWARSSNELFVLTDNGGVLEGLGSLQGLAPGETIRSVRFMGGRAFVVTFRNIDPLFALDLSDPLNPREVGQLKIPGFSSYLQFVGDHYLVGLGRNTPDGWNGPPQLTLFDVSDSGAPVVVDQFTWDHWSRTEAATDPHAFGYYAEHDMLAIPVGNSRREWVDEDGDGFRDTWVSQRQDDLYVFQLGLASSDPTNPRIELLGTVSHEGQVRRSGYIADRLYSVSTDDIIVSDIADPSVAIARVVFGATMNDDELAPPRLAAEQTASPLDDAPLRDALQAANADMAERLQIEPGQITLVTAEADAHAYELVLQAEGARYLYHAPTAGAVELVNTDFDFTAAMMPRHNATNPLDTNDDGQISPLDALLVINVLNDMAARTSRTVPLRAVDRLAQQSRSEYYIDTNGDGLVAPIDALRVINRLNAVSPAAAAAAEVDARPRAAAALIASAGPPAQQPLFSTSTAMPIRPLRELEAASSAVAVESFGRAERLPDRSARVRVTTGAATQPQTEVSLQGVLTAQLHDRYFAAPES